MAIPEIRQYMTVGPHVIEGDELVEQARAIMRENDIRHLPVLRDGEPVGVLSARDLLFLDRLPGVGSSVKVEEVMVGDPYQVTADTAIDGAADEMAKRKLSAAIVTRGGRVIGIFTVIDALRALADIARRSDEDTAPVASSAGGLEVEIIKLLLQVAWADHEVEEREVEHILELGKRASMSREELAALRDNLLNQKQLPPPNFARLREDPDAVMDAVRGLVGSDGFVVDDEAELMEEIHSLLVTEE